MRQATAKKTQSYRLRMWKRKLERGERVPGFTPTAGEKTEVPVQPVEPLATARRSIRWKNKSKPKEEPRIIRV